MGLMKIADFQIADFRLVDSLAVNFRFVVLKN